MNKVALMGRLTRDVDTRQGDTTVGKFSLAVPRKGNKNESDFINCAAFGKTAELIAQYFHKGSKIALIGHIQTGSYTKQDGTKVYTTDVIVDEWEFCEKSSGNGSANSGFMTTNEGFDF